MRQLQEGAQGQHAKPKMAMHNDPMQRKIKYEKEGAVSRSGHHEGRMEAEDSETANE
jgi:hypothetical protein